MSNKFYISIVSHGHYEFIENNSELERIAKRNDVIIVIKDNIDDDNLKIMVQKKGYVYISSEKHVGFGENNNDIYDYIKAEFNVSLDDWFIILNPDVLIELTEFEKLVNELSSTKDEFFTPNLYKDINYQTPENSIRKFTKIIHLLNPFMLKPVNIPFNKGDLNDKDTVDWASGAFLCIRNRSFERVLGFNIKYFMYYEDVDLCYRLNRLGIRLRFLKDVKAAHKGEYKNRSIFSQHFIWYFTSLMRFLLIK